MKRFISFILIAASVFILVSCKTSSPVTTSSNVGTEKQTAAPVQQIASRSHRLVDEVSLLSRTESAVLSKQLDNASEKYNFDIVVITVQSMSDDDAREYLQDRFEKSGYGMGENKDGIAFLVAVNSGEVGERVWATYTTAGLSSELFNDSVLNDIEDKVLSYLRESEYYDGFIEFCRECEAVLSGQANGNPTNSDNN